MSGILPEKHKTVGGSASATTTASTTIIAAPDIGRLCISGLQIGRSDAGTTAITVALNDPAGSTFVVPGFTDGNTTPYTFDAPIMMAIQTALKFTASAAVSTLFVNAQGFVLE